MVFYLEKVTGWLGFCKLCPCRKTLLPAQTDSSDFQRAMTPHLARRSTLYHKQDACQVSNPKFFRPSQDFGGHSLHIIGLFQAIADLPAGPHSDGREPFGSVRTASGIPMWFDLYTRTYCVCKATFLTIRRGASASVAALSRGRYTWGRHEMTNDEGMSQLEAVSKPTGEGACATPTSVLGSKTMWLSRPRLRSPSAKQVLKQLLPNRPISERRVTG